jgi:hypothetical protein
MLVDVFNMLFGCWHKNYSFPITAKKGTKNHLPHAARVTGTYVVCLDCGKEFPYDWNKMKILTSESGRTEAIPLTAEAVTGLGKVA